MTAHQMGGAIKRPTAEYASLGISSCSIRMTSSAREPADILHFVVIDIKPVIDGDERGSRSSAKKRKGQGCDIM